MKLGITILAGILLGCSHSTPPPQAETPDSFQVPAEQHAQMCESLVEHAIVVFADAWADSQGLPKDKFVRDYVHKRYREELLEQGGPQHAYSWCMAKVNDLSDFECALAAQSPEDYEHCLPYDGD